MSKVAINDCVMKGQHVYNHAVDVDGTYECTPEPNNVRNHRAIAVRSSSNQVMGHVQDNLCHSMKELFDHLPHKIHIFW